MLLGRSSGRIRKKFGCSSRGKRKRFGRSFEGKWKSFFHFPSKLQPKLFLFPLELRPNFFLFLPEPRPRSTRFWIKGLFSFNRWTNSKKWDGGKVYFHAPFHKFGMKFPFKATFSLPFPLGVQDKLKKMITSLWYHGRCNISFCHSNNCSMRKGCNRELKMGNMVKKGENRGLLILLLVEHLNGDRLQYRCPCQNLIESLHAGHYLRMTLHV